MLDLPRVADPETVGQLDLLERVADEPLLGVLGPGPGELVLVEDAELHVRVRGLPGVTLLWAARDRQGMDDVAWTTLLTQAPGCATNVAAPTARLSVSAIADLLPTVTAE